MCSYYNQNRKVPVKHGDTKSAVSIGHHEVSKLRMQVLWQFPFFTQNTKTKGGIFCSVYWILEICPLFIRMLIVIRITGPPEQRGGGGGRGEGRIGGSPARLKFFVNAPFFRTALEVPFLKEVTKNVHEN